MSFGQHSQRHECVGDDRVGVEAAAAETVVTSLSVCRPRNLARTGPGAMIKIASIWLPAAVCALTAERRARCSALSPSIARFLIGVDRSPQHCPGCVVGV